MCKIYDRVLEFTGKVTTLNGVTYLEVRPDYGNSPIGKNVWVESGIFVITMKGLTLSNTVLALTHSFVVGSKSSLHLDSCFIESEVSVTGSLTLRRVSVKESLKCERDKYTLEDTDIVSPVAVFGKDEILNPLGLNTVLANKRSPQDNLWLKDITNLIRYDDT